MIAENLTFSRTDDVQAFRNGTYDVDSKCAKSGHCYLKTASSTDLAYSKSSSLVSKYVVCE